MTKDPILRIRMLAQSFPELWKALGVSPRDAVALACIGLTVPVVVLASVVLGLPLILGLEPKDIAMLAVTFLVSAVTLGTGRTYMMQGAVHLVLFAAYLFLAFVP